MREPGDRQILDRAAQILQQSSGGIRDIPPARSSFNWPATERLARSLDRGQPRIGDMPRQPPTLRARVGAALVRLVRRGLFWYSDQVLTFQGLAANAAAEQVRIFEQLAASGQRIEELSAKVRALDRLAHESKQLALEQGLRLRMVLKELRSSPSAPDSTAEPSPGSDEQWPQLVRAHADVFRGTRSDIRERLRVYLPYARRSIESTGRAPVLDLGCGRGEWLELMHEEGFPAKGVDASMDMVRGCREAGLEVEHAHLLSYLRTDPDESQSVVTAFHVVEHLVWDDLLELIDHAVRVLKPGGVVIFETPNARNLQVASYTFHLDPSHVRPLPSELLSFLVEARGLCEPKTVFLHPYPDSFHLDDEDHSAAAKFINQAFYGPQDYAIIAKKI